MYEHVDEMLASVVLFNSLIIYTLAMTQASNIVNDPQAPSLLSRA